jgi:hypothetical protein
MTPTLQTVRLWDLDTVIPVSVDITCSQLCLLYYTVGEFDHIRLLTVHYLIEFHLQNDLTHWRVFELLSRAGLLIYARYTQIAEHTSLPLMIASYLTQFF